jgi:hypothetical protein
VVLFSFPLQGMGYGPNKEKEEKKESSNAIMDT